VNRSQTISEEGRLLIGGKEISYTVHHSKKRRRTLALYVESVGKIRVLVPMRTSVETIRRMFEDRQHWIAKRLSEIETSPSSPQKFKDGAVFSYLGQPHILHITRDPLSPQTCSAENGQLNLNLHSSADEQANEDARLEIQLWYKKKAKEILKERTDYWSATLGLKCRSLKVGSPLRQWGSCSPANDIRYNWRIVLAPLDLIDYLVVHELCHIAHKNHSRRFWTLLASAIPDWQTRRKRLRAFDPALVF
jgi:predicted metal-dependent hydrolase